MAEHYTEPLSASEPIRKLYADSVSNAVALMRTAAKLRREQIVTPASLAANREQFRAQYAHMLGIDTCREVIGVGAPELERSPVGEDELCTIERAKFKLTDGIYFTGLILTPKKRSTRSPLVVMSHGGGGSPELCCDIIGANNYGGVVRRILSTGCIVFAPQLLLWSLSAKLCESNIPQYTAKYNRADSDRELKQCGASIAGFEIYAISRAIDKLVTLPEIIPEQLGMLGLSYGGFYTLYTMAYDTRIKSGWSAAFFNDRIRYNWYDFVWKDSAGRFLDTEVAGLCAPRRLWCDIGTQDTVFDASGVAELAPRVEEFFRSSNAADEVRVNIWKGGHRFSDSNENESGAMKFFLRGIGVNI